MAAVWKACRQPLSKHGLSVVQTTKKVKEEIILVTKLLHKSGQWIKGELPLDLPKDDVIEYDKYGKPKKRNKQQVMASAVTYTRRVALSGIAGVAPDDDTDDDAESCNLPVEQEKDKKQRKEKEKVPQSTPKEPPLPINPEEFKRFKEENHLNNRTSDMYVYLSDIAPKRNMTMDQMLEYCFRNKDGFFKAYKEYQAEKLKKIQNAEQKFEKQELEAFIQ